MKVGFSVKEGLAIDLRSGKARWRLHLPLGPVTVGGKRRAAYLSFPGRPLRDRDVGRLGGRTLDLSVERASLILTDNAVLATTVEGDVLVLRKDKEKYDLARKYKVASSAVWARSAFAGGEIFIKDETHLRKYRGL